MKIDEKRIRELTKLSWEMRLELLDMFSYGKAHHFGGSLSCMEIISALYFYKMNFKKDNYKALERDRFIMSKGHSVPAQYVGLSMLGIIPHDELKTIKKIGSRLQGHPDVLKTPGIEAPTGSLGQGLSYANGIALAAKEDKINMNIFVMIGDGELQEGQVWEAAMTTSSHKLTNVCVIIDRNKFQSQGNVDELKKISPLDEKFQAFGWETVSIDGHDIKQICNALDLVSPGREKPLAIIADTVKGKGISFMENTYKYHNYSMSKEEYESAREELVEHITNMKKD